MRIKSFGLDQPRLSGSLRRMSHRCDERYKTKQLEKPFHTQIGRVGRYGGNRDNETRELCSANPILLDTTADDDRHGKIDMAGSKDLQFGPDNSDLAKRCSR